MTAAFPQAHSAVAVAALPVAAIGPSPSNPRKHIDEAYLDELAASITSHGVIQPITVRPNPRGADPLYELVVGECRWRAAQRAGLTDIPAFWRELDDKQVLEIQVIENLQRRDIHPIEEAEGYEQLMKRYGYKTEDIAAKIGKSKAYVYARLKLTALCESAREAFYAGKLDASTALLVARIPQRLQKKATREITEAYDGEPMSYRRAVWHIRNHFTVSLAQATFPLGDAELVPAAGACAECPKRSGNDRALADHFGDADVCTDTACFEDKRAARHLQLIALAESRQIPVLRGEAAEEIAPGGRLWNINRDRHTMLDDVVEGDAEQRTYREILGDEAPVSALIEFDIGPGKRLVEVAETTAIEAALEKAGWQPAEPPETPEEETDEQRAEREALAAGKAAREAKAQQVEAEQTWRTRLADALWPQVRAQCHRDADLLSDRILRIAAIAWLRQEISWTEWPDELLKRCGFTLPEEFDDDEEIEKIGAGIAGWPIGDVLVFLLDAFTQFERSEFYGDDSPPVTLLALAQAVGLDAENLRDPETTPDPIPAAQAPETNAVEPAAPANEPAVPVKPAAWKQAWPFPIPETSVEAEKPALPEPNAHGVYPHEKAEALTWQRGKNLVTIRLLETTAGWIHSIEVKHRHGSASGPLKIHDGVTWTSRDAALQDAADEALDRCLAPQVDHGYTAKEKKALREWLTELARSAEASA